MGAAPDAEQFLARAARLQEDDPRLTPIQAAILVAAQEGIAEDSRSFARVFDLAHALVLRELTALEQRTDTLRIIRRDERTMRVFYKRDGKLAADNGD